jgi:hypothetical protein
MEKNAKLESAFEYFIVIKMITFLAKSEEVT